MRAILHTQSFERRNRLADLGLDEEILRQALQRGFSEWAACTLNHPPSYPGLLFWGETVKVLRDLLAPAGWERSNEGNLPFTVNKARTVAIAVATGDEVTGNPDETPCTKSSKGPHTAGAIRINARQLDLFPIAVLPEDLARIKGDGKRMTWLLLFHRDENGREVRCELSRPTSMSENQHVDGWIERIILGSIPFDGDMTQLPADNAPEGPAVDAVEIKRRA
jgi:hypothetical protein